MDRPTRARALHARRRSLALPAIAAALLSAACRRDPAAPPPAAAPAPELATSIGAARPASAAAARLPKVTTGVNLVPAGGAAVRARAGAPLRPGDALRSTWGNAEVALPDGTVVWLDERSEVRLVALDPEGARLALVRGRVQIDPARDTAAPPKVELPEGGIVASGRGGRWSALATPSALAVAAQKGTVRLESAGGAVEVGPGTTSSAWRGRAPLAPAPWGRTALSATAPEGEQVPADVCAMLQGAAVPGAEVRVGGKAVEVAEDGTFRVTVPRAGNAVDVVARHASGTTERRRVPCAEAALSNFEVEWDER